MFSFTRGTRNPTRLTLLSLWFLLWLMPLPLLYAGDNELKLDDLIAEGLKNNPEIAVAQSRAQAAGYRIPQVKALPDPMFMFGYQNEGFEKFTIGEAEGAMGMFTISQMFPFPGKQGLKGEMAAKDAQSLAAMYQAKRLNIVSRIKEIYYDLFLAYKNLDILKERAELFSRIEDAATARYSSGMGTQQEVVMAQTEKYILLEREEMQKQKVQTLQGMLNAVVGRPVGAPLTRPEQIRYTSFEGTFEEALIRAESRSPEIVSKNRMIEGAEAKVKMAKKEYYPDVTLSAGYFPRTRGMMDMWNLTASVNLPIFTGTKQKQAVFEANAQVSEAKHELEVIRLMLASSVRENFSMLQATDRLMKLYKEGLFQKANQDVQLAISGYVAGKIEAFTVIARVKNLLDYDTLYWQQFVEREKAIARLHALTGTDESPAVKNEIPGLRSSQ